MLMHITAKPDSRKESVIKISETRLQICVRESAEGNQANRRIIGILRARYPGSRIRMVSGHHSRSKTISIDET